MIQRNGSSRVVFLVRLRQPLCLVLPAQRLPLPGGDGGQRPPEPALGMADPRPGLWHHTETLGAELDGHLKCAVAARQKPLLFFSVP